MLLTSTDSTVTFEIHQVSDVSEVTSSIHSQKGKNKKNASYTLQNRRAWNLKKTQVCP